MFLKLENNAKSTLVSPSGIGTTIQVLDGSRFPNEFPYVLTIWDSVVYPDPGDDSNMEQILVTGKSGNTLTVTRGYGGSGVKEHGIGSNVALLLTKAYFKDAIYGSETNFLAHVGNASIHMLPSEKTKLAGIEAGANNYVLPVASPDMVGGVMVGQGLAIEDGILRTIAGENPDGDMRKEVYDTNNNGKVDIAEVAELVHWNNVEAKPTAFTPSIHATSHTTGIDKIPNATTILDGLMSKEDKTKLDGIVGGGAGGEITPEDLLSAIKTVDGVGSGLDADLLDGLDSTDFALVSHNHSGVYEPVIAVKRTAFNKDYGNIADTVCQGNDSRLSNARTPLPHTHTEAQISDLKAYELAFSKNSAFNKNFGIIAGTVCEGNDYRLADARPPTAHTHTESQITNLKNYVVEGDSRLTDARTPTAHGHDAGDITGMQEAISSEVALSLEGILEDIVDSAIVENEQVGLNIIHRGLLDNPHQVTTEQIGAISISEIGVPNGIAPLNDEGKVSLEYLPAIGSDLDLQAILDDAEELISPPNDAWVLVAWNGQIYKSKVGNIRRSD